MSVRITHFVTVLALYTIIKCRTVESKKRKKISASKCLSDVSDEMEFARKLCISAKMLTTKIYYYPEPDSRPPADISFFPGFIFVPQQNGMRVSE